jgi:hypothetical protein
MMPDHISIAHSSTGIRSSSVLDVPFHPHVRLLAQCRGRLSRHADKAPTKARFVPLSAEPPTQRPMTLPSSTFRDPWPPDTVNTLSPRPYPRPRKLLCQQCQVVLECLKVGDGFRPNPAKRGACANVCFGDVGQADRMAAAGAIRPFSGSEWNFDKSPKHEPASRENALAS